MRVGKAGIYFRTEPQRTVTASAVVSKAGMRTEVAGSLPLSPHTWSLAEVVEGPCLGGGVSPLDRSLLQHRAAAARCSSDNMS